MAVWLWLTEAEAGGEHGWFQLGEGEHVSIMRSKAPRQLAACSRGRLRNRAGFGLYFQVLELICSEPVRVVLFSVMV